MRSLALLRLTVPVALYELYRERRALAVFLPLALAALSDEVKPVLPQPAKASEATHNMMILNFFIADYNY